MIWVWAIWPKPPALEVTFLNVGQGDAIVVRTPSGHTAVIDCGSGPSARSDFDAGAKTVAPFLRHEGVNIIDALVLSHPHEDHVGGVPSVLREFTVKNVLDSGAAHPTGSYLKTLELVEDRSIPYRRIMRGNIIRFGDGVKMEVLNPPAGAAEAEGDEGMNDLSLVVRLTYQNVSFLLTGDADQDSEEDMLSSCPNLSAQVLKVAHHGSSKATTAEWLAAVRPEIAVISVGYKNQFGHPSPATLKRLEAAGVQVYRTDENGGITITTDGHKIAVATSRRFR